MTDSDKGYKVINPGTIDVKFHVYDNSLRDTLCDDDLLPYNNIHDSQMTDSQKARMDERSIFPLTAFLGSYSLTKFKKMIVDKTDNLALIDIFKDFAEQTVIVEKLAREVFARDGTVSYNMLPFVLGEGTIQGIDAGEGTIHAAEVVSVDARSHYIAGEYYKVIMRIVAISQKGHVYTNITYPILKYQGSMSLAELGLLNISPSLRATLIERGRKYVALTKNPGYVNYNSTMVRRSYYGNRTFRAAGRVMIDLGSMKMMDPQYKDYYGEESAGSRHDEAEDLKKNYMDLTSESNLLICSPYVYGFSFKAKVWGEMTVDSIEQIAFRDDAFDKLVLEPKVKRIIGALVEHSGSEGGGDLIDGKGGGCSFLLDGNPGIGKTLTAESIAEKLHRPLYSVSSGELGTEPVELANKLKDILDMCATWNAILLIDEADIFMEKRNKNDIHRNAMVGIFLQLIEYYQGILFLTTNRVEEIDGAFYSRISLSIHYPELDFGSRLVVWQNLLAFVKSKDESIDPHLLALKDLNGRQIKHIVRLASTLAQQENVPMSTEHIQMITDVGLQFELDTAKVKAATIANLPKGILVE